MSKVIHYLPELEGEEQIHVAQLMTSMSDEQAEQFASVYRERRRDPVLTLLMALVGFVGIAGVHRFLLDQIVMGLLYLFTAGFCFIGTVVDMINHKQLTSAYNMRQADEVALLIEGVLPLPPPPPALPEAD